MRFDRVMQNLDSCLLRHATRGAEIGTAFDQAAVARRNAESLSKRDHTGIGIRLSIEHLGKGDLRTHAPSHQGENGFV